MSYSTHFILEENYSIAYYKFIKQFYFLVLSNDEPVEFVMSEIITDPKGIKYNRNQIKFQVVTGKYSIIIGTSKILNVN